MQGESNSLHELHLSKQETIQCKERAKVYMSSTFLSKWRFNARREQEFTWAPPFSASDDSMQGESKSLHELHLSKQVTIQCKERAKVYMRSTFLSKWRFNARREQKFTWAPPFWGEWRFNARREQKFTWAPPFEASDDSMQWESKSLHELHLSKQVTIQCKEKAFLNKGWCWGGWGRYWKSYCQCLTACKPRSNRPSTSRPPVFGMSERGILKGFYELNFLDKGTSSGRRKPDYFSVNFHVSFEETIQYHGWSKISIMYKSWPFCGINICR